MNNHQDITLDAPNVDAPTQFIRRLQSCGRGELAILRRNAGSTLANSRNATGVFYRMMPYGHQRDEEIYFLVATLYPSNNLDHTGDFGATMRDVFYRSGAESVHRRMAILLDSTFDYLGDGQWGGGELSFRLRQAVRMAAGHNVGINWIRLLEDLCRWMHPAKRVQKRWARSYFGKTVEADGGESGGGE